jgi:dTDP-glucose pyrophosphorylase
MQPKQEGLVHAIESARDSINGEDFLLLLGDEIMLNPRHGSMIVQFRTENLFGICGGLIEKRRERIAKTYAIIQDETNRICRLIEKPRKPPNEWMGTGSCVFKNEIYSYISRTPVNPNRGEKELPDLIQCAVDEGETVKSFLICDRYFNVNAPEDLQEAQHGLVVLTPVGTQ